MDQVAEFVVVYLLHLRKEGEDCQELRRNGVQVRNTSADYLNDFLGKGRAKRSEREEGGKEGKERGPGQFEKKRTFSAESENGEQSVEEMRREGGHVGRNGLDSDRNKRLESGGIGLEEVGTKGQQKGESLGHMGVEGGVVEGVNEGRKHLR